MGRMETATSVAVFFFGYGRDACRYQRLFFRRLGVPDAGFCALPGFCALRGLFGFLAGFCISSSLFRASLAPRFLIARIAALVLALTLKAPWFCSHA